MTRGRGAATYLQPGADQDRLLDLMATSHAFDRHGSEFKLDPPAFRERARTHLRDATIGISVTDSLGQPRFLLADPATEQVAWITPHKEQQSTLFRPRSGAERYARTQAVQAGKDGWRFLDLPRLRAGPTQIHSAARAPGRTRRPELGR